MRNCVVHRVFVFAQARNDQASLSYRNLAQAALFDIEDILRQDPACVVYDDPDPEGVARFFSSGEEIILYGAYLGACLTLAYRALVKKGCIPQYHPTGSLPFESNVSL
ncbi:hypothetical protein EXS74_03060 [Candidatus Woesearchaeota archaeon]|nr:hypothetical protein [Candidatus Woesearchaeota archaeon]